MTYDKSYITAEEDEHGVFYCSHEQCPQYDGKRCRLTGFQPHGVCEPWAIDAARDKKAMDAMREFSADICSLDQCEDTEGNWFWIAEVGKWGLAEDADPAEAINKSAAVNRQHLKDREAQRQS